MQPCDICLCLCRFVYFLMFICFLIAWPISKLLDCLLGKDHHTVYQKSELKALVGLHGPQVYGTLDSHQLSDKGVEAARDMAPLSGDEVMIIKVGMIRMILEFVRLG